MAPRGLLNVSTAGSRDLWLCRRRAAARISRRSDRADPDLPAARNVADARPKGIPVPRDRTQFQCHLYIDAELAELHRGRPARATVGHTDSAGAIRHHLPFPIQHCDVGAVTPPSRHSRAVVAATVGAVPALAAVDADEPAILEQYRRFDQGHGR